MQFHIRSCIPIRAKSGKLLKTLPAFQEQYLLNSFKTLKAFFMCQGFTVTGQCFSVLSSFKSRGFCWHNLVHLKKKKDLLTMRVCNQLNY